MPRRVTTPPPNFREFDVPTTPDVRESALVRSLVVRNGTENGRLKLSATLAGHLLGYLGSPCLTPEDRKLKRKLRAFANEWAKVERQAWRALTFQQARTRKSAPLRVENRRREPQAREGRSSRRVATVATRAGPDEPSGSSEDDPPSDLISLRGYGAASVRMVQHVGRRLGAARTA